ncbi:uncharacterized protein LOC122852686 [Aphidius gifuensis]|nr:uncharacterized protein LOC122852686 [Aphidius gifuensis]XP_044008563.1 uncharacterized protein LOC122852686 [Aphidius gifuensis]
MKDEFLKIRNEMEAANVVQNKLLIEKISLLKKSLLKMEKSKQKIYFECQQKIFEIQKSKDIEIKTMQLQLQGHKNELSTSMSTEKQCELDSILNLLEERYKCLLASSEANVDNQRQKYLQKMKSFEDQLARLKNNLMENETYF